MNKVIVFSRFKSLLLLLFVFSSFGVNFVDIFGMESSMPETVSIPKETLIENDLEKEQKGIAGQIFDNGKLNSSKVGVFAGEVVDIVKEKLSIGPSEIEQKIMESKENAINVATAFKRVANDLVNGKLGVNNESDFFSAVDEEVENIVKAVNNVEKIVLKNDAKHFPPHPEKNPIMGLESFVEAVSKPLEKEIATNKEDLMKNIGTQLQLTNYRGLYNKIQSEVKEKGESGYEGIFNEVLAESKSQKKIFDKNYNKYGIYNVGYIVRRRSLGKGLEQYDEDENQNPCRFRIGFDKVGIGMKITSFISKSLYLLGVLELTNNVHFDDGSTKNYRYKVGFANKKSWIKNDIIGFLNCFYLDFFPMKDVYTLSYGIARLCFSEIPHVPICFSWLWNVSAKASFLNGLLGKRVEFYYAKFRPIMFIIGTLQCMFLELVPIVSYDRLCYYNVCKQDDLLLGNEELHCISNFEFLMSVSFTFQLMVLEVKIAKYLYIQFSFWDVVKLIWPKIKAKFVDNSDENGLDNNGFNGDSLGQSNSSMSGMTHKENMRSNSNKDSFGETQSL